MEEQNIRKISFNIYADTNEEAEKGRQAIIQFINILGQHGAKVSGNKLSDAVSLMQSTPFIATQIINYFKKQ